MSHDRLEIREAIKYTVKNFKSDFDFTESLVIAHMQQLVLRGEITEKKFEELKIILRQEVKKHFSKEKYVQEELF